MAIYQNADFFTQQTNADFNTTWEPGNQPKHSGIYKCMGCGNEVVAEKERKLPPQNHHQHTSTQGSIRWKLVVRPS